MDDAIHTLTAPRLPVCYVLETDSVADLAVAGAAKILKKDVDANVHAALLAELKRQL